MTAERCLGRVSVLWHALLHLGRRWGGGWDTARFLLVAQWRRGLGGLWAASVLAAEGLPAPCCRTGSSAPRGCVAQGAAGEAALKLRSVTTWSRMSRAALGLRRQLPWASFCPPQSPTLGQRASAPLCSSVCSAPGLTSYPVQVCLRKLVACEGAARSAVTFRVRAVMCQAACHGTPGGTGSPEHRAQGLGEWDMAAGSCGALDRDQAALSASLVTGGRVSALRLLCVQRCSPTRKRVRAALNLVRGPRLSKLLSPAHCPP